ncbi:class I SAM-dependent methyltransferase [Mesorhizobium sp. 1M-11]|uniref:class I SAM-dependent methyltransferase n=1 Tax=Mesorhizobium sp. 1M-11 TaxID=1529006 RepID=UPI0006C7551E|nr:class I SAM-dependent methyltransferase [Mesorhizobium sp. 1M-11]
MSADTLKTLFHPFEADALPLPGPGKRALFLGAEPGLRLPTDFGADLHLVQGFRPDFRLLQTSGHTVSPQVEGENYDLAFVLAGKHRGLNELHIAEAIERTCEGGVIVVAGGKEDGIASLRKRTGELVAMEGHLSKHHGQVFWFARPDSDIAAKLRAANPSVLVEDRYETAPGMFSFDRVDAGSRFLAEHLPADIKGHAADFCAGWGYLSVALAERTAGLTGLDLYEADHAALQAAGRTLARLMPDLPVRRFWHDLAGEPVDARYDVIVMNPPFHRGRAAEPELGAAIIRAAAKALKPGGRLFIVANRQLPYERVLAEAFSSHTEIVRNDAFKVLLARR